MSARYEVEDVVGRGAMGVVYRARQTGTANRVVAYKRLAAEAEGLHDGLCSEAQILAALDHPNIIRIFDVIEDSGGTALIMQFAAGGSLAQRLAAGRPVQVGDAVVILAAIAEALASAHRRDVLHGDIKPSNILFTADGHPLLSDFGLARSADGVVLRVGTPEYTDPAVLAGSPYDASSDVYALGAVGYEMLTGRRPFGPGEALAVTAPGVPKEISEAISSALSQVPAQRPTASAFAAALRLAVRQLPAKSVWTSGAGAASADSGPSGLVRTDPPTRPFGPPRPAMAAKEPDRAVPWRRIVAAAVAFVLVPPAVVLLGNRPQQASGKTVAPAAVTAALPSCPGRPAPPSAPGVLTGDLDARGCRAWVRFADGVVTLGLTPSASWRIGSADDQLLLGDWDCNGTHTAALYQRSTGMVFLFDDWPQPDRRLRSAVAFDSGITDGIALAKTGACDEVQVRPAGPGQPSNSSRYTTLPVGPW